MTDSWSIVWHYRYVERLRVGAWQRFLCAQKRDRGQRAPGIFFFERRDLYIYIHESEVYIRRIHIMIIFAFNNVHLKGIITPLIFSSFIIVPPIDLLSDIFLAHIRCSTSFKFTLTEKKNDTYFSNCMYYFHLGRICSKISIYKIGEFCKWSQIFWNINCCCCCFVNMLDKTFSWDKKLTEIRKENVFWSISEVFFRNLFLEIYDIFNNWGFPIYCACVMTCIVLYWIFSENLHSSESLERYLDFVQKTGVVTSQIENVPFLDFFWDYLSTIFFNFETSWLPQEKLNVKLNVLHEWKY